MADAHQRSQDPDWVAQHFGISKRGVYRLVETGAIPHYRVGGLLRFRPSEVESWLAELRNAGASA